MNKLSGQILKQTKVDDLCLLEIDLGSTVFKSIVIEENVGSTYQVGENVELFFKETEAVLTKDLTISISLQNRLEGVVESINKGELLSVLKIKYNQQIITSIITTSSLNRLCIKEKDKVLALIKTNEIMISK